MAETLMQATLMQARQNGKFCGKMNPVRRGSEANLVVMCPGQACELDVVQPVFQIIGLPRLLVNAEHLHMHPVRAAAAERVGHELAILAESCAAQCHLQNTTGGCTLSEYCGAAAAACLTKRAAQDSME